MFYNAQAFPRSGWHFGPAEAQDLHSMPARLGRRPGWASRSSRPGDTIHGYKTTYPTQSALAAARNYPLDYKLGDMQRREQLEVGTRGVLGPLAEVGTKVLYPRIQEGNGENADVAAAQVRALVAGLQGGPELNPRVGAGHGQALAGRGRRRRGADRLRRGHHQVPHDPVPGRDGGRRGQHHARLRRQLVAGPGRPGRRRQRADPGLPAPEPRLHRPHHHRLAAVGLLGRRGQRRLRRDGRRRPGRGRLLHRHLHRRRARRRASTTPSGGCCG